MSQQLLLKSLTRPLGTVPLFARAWLVILLLATANCTRLWAEQPAAAPTDPDFAIQGEYQGEITTPAGKQKLGVQVIAQGKGKFHVVVFSGGLPGAGWDKSDRPECDAETANGSTKFAFGEYTAQIKDGSVTLTTTGGVAVGELKKLVRKSPTLGAEPPAGAVVLFDGKSADQFDNGRMSDDGLLMPGATSKAKFQSGKLHVEFRIPFDPQEPHRGNSGCYLQGRYEVQILDSLGFKLDPHECGGIPSVKAADVNMCFPPLSWQTYDVDFTAAEYQDGKKTRNARMTVRHNGVLTHQDVEVPNVTTAAPVPEDAQPGPLNLQEHGGQVRFRNIWFLEKK